MSHEKSAASSHEIVDAAVASLPVPAYLEEIYWCANVEQKVVITR